MIQSIGAPVIVLGLNTFVIITAPDSPLLHSIESELLADHGRWQAALAALSVARGLDPTLGPSREVEQAYISVSEASERIQAAQVAVASAQENFRLAQGRFDAGVGTILELTDAQLALTQTQNAEAQALADYRIAVVRLERALGQR